MSTETEALVALTRDINRLHEEEEEVASILKAREKDFRVAVVVAGQHRGWHSIDDRYNNHRDTRVARFMGDMIVDYIPQMLEMVLEHRRREVQAHRERVLAMYQGTTTALSPPKLQLVLK